MTKGQAKPPADPMATPPPIERDAHGRTYDEVANPLHEAGQAALRLFRDARAGLPPTPQYIATPAGIRPHHPRGPGNKGEGEFEARLCQALGTKSTNVAYDVVHQLLNGPGLTGARVTDDERVKAINDGVAFIAASESRSEIETLILLQVWHTSQASATMLRRAVGADMLPQLEANGSLAVKLGGLQVRQLEALAKIRSAGKQVIEVQHVHVYPGGNAVVGTINAGGATPGIEGQSHAIALAHLAEVRGEDPERAAVPVASDPRQGTVSDARRPGRRTEG